MNYGGSVERWDDVGGKLKFLILTMNIIINRTMTLCVFVCWLGSPTDENEASAAHVIGRQCTLSV